MIESRITRRKNRVLKQAVELLEDRRLLSTVYSADFETPLSADWQITGTPSQLWHVTTVRSQSGTHSLYYGRDAEHNYDIGTNSGTVTTPAINLAGVTSPALQFRYLLHIEALMAEDTVVQISSDPTFSTWKTLASDNPNTAAGETALINSATNDVTWLTWSGSLAAYAGSTIKLRFSFDSWDNLQNNYEGWYVDDLIVSATDAPPSVTGITPADSSVIGSSSANIQFTFSENVNGVDATDLTLSGPAATGASVTGVSGSGNVWTFAVSGLSAGVLTTTLAKDAGDITDSAGQSPSTVVTKLLVVLPDAYDAAAANETIGAASDLGVVGGTRTFNNLTLHTESDVDYYKFTADATGPVTLTLAYDDTVIDMADVGFYAYDSNQAKIIEPDPQDLDGTITLPNVTKGQTYYVQVLSETQRPSNSYTLTINAPAEAPTVTGVYAKGTTWATSVLTFIEQKSLGSSLFGYAIPGGTGQLRDLPWGNVNQLTVTFSEPVSASTAGVLLRSGRFGTALGLSTSYDAAHNALLITTSSSLAYDKLLLQLSASGGGQISDLAGTALDGEWANSADTFPSGNGTAGGEFQFRLDVLPGNADDSSRVNALDNNVIRAALNQTPASQTYSVFADLDGSGRVTALDANVIRANLNVTLAAIAEPTAGTFSSMVLNRDFAIDLLA